MKDIKMSQKLTESGLMIAFATILSMIKIIDLPYGGSVTFASMLPLVIIAYRYKFSWAALTGFVYGLIQLLLGMNTLSYATWWGAVIAIILIDYIFAFMSTALGGVFKKTGSSAAALGRGAFLVCVVRYIFHVISGATVWAGLSIPTKDALVYSFAYNATYMLPEAIITVVAAVALGSVIDFSTPMLSLAKKKRIGTLEYILNVLIGVTALACVSVAAVLIFPHLQNAETGNFDITGIQNVNLTALIITVAAAVLVIAALVIAKKLKRKKV